MKLFKTLSLIALAAISTTTFAACKSPSGSNISSSNETSEPITPPASNESSNPNVSFSSEYISKADDLQLYNRIIKDQSADVPFEQFTDGIYNYFYFRLGEIYNVPIYYSDILNFTGVGEQTLAITNSETIETTIEKSTSNCLNSTIGQSFSDSISFNPTLSIDNVSFSVMSMGHEESTQASYSLTTSTEYKTGLSESISKSSMNSLKLTSTAGDPKGKYRFIITSDVAVYATIIADPTSETFTCKYSMATLGNQEQGWYYGTSEDLKLETSLAENQKLTLSEEAISSIDLYSNPGSTKYLRKCSFSYSKTITTYPENYHLWWSISSLINSEAINAFEFSKAVVTISFSTKTPSGACTASIETYLNKDANESGKIGSWEADADGTKRNYTERYTVSLAQLLACDGTLLLDLWSTGNYALDFSKNECNFSNIKVSIELK